MMNIRKSAFALCLTVFLLLSLLLPGSALAAAPVTVARADLPRITGTFIQPWLYSGWDDARWRSEMEVYQQLGIKYIVMGDSANYRQDKTWQVEYPTKLEMLKKDGNVNDRITPLMNYCKEYGIKVILGIGTTYNWSAWDLSSEAGGKAMLDWRKESLPIMDELYQQYKKAYGDTFYGWYWAEELYNDKKWDIDTQRAAYAKNLAACFNLVLAERDRLDPSMPLFLSPYVNSNATGPYSGYSCTDLNKIADFWGDFISKTNFRPTDTLMPQACLDHLTVHLDNLDAWTRVYADGIKKANKSIRFWSNIETFHGNDVSVVDVNLADHAYSKPLSTLCDGMAIVSNYCDTIFTFSYPHYYSPYITIPGYHQSYLYYLTTGTVEKNRPVGPNRIKTETSKEGLTLSWSGQWDDFGIGRTNIYKDGKLVDYVHNTYGNNILLTTTAKWTDKNYAPGKDAAVYEIEIIDVSGNAAEKVSYAVCAENENNGVELEPKYRYTYDPAHPMAEAGAKPPAASLVPITGNKLFSSAAAWYAEQSSAGEAQEEEVSPWLYAGLGLLVVFAAGAVAFALIVTKKKKEGSDK